MRTLITGGLTLGLSLAGASLAAAQTPVSLPSSTRTTTFAASVSEQARITVPAGITFNVADVTATTNASSASIQLTNIVLAAATKQLRVSVQANAASFTPPVAGATTWSASDVSWTIPNGGPNTWLNGTRTNGSLSSGAFATVGTCDPDAASCGTIGFAMSLAAKPTVKQAGAHTLLVTWKIESIGS